MEKRALTGGERYERNEANERKCIEAMRSVVKRNMLMGTSRLVFNTLFPTSDEAEPFANELRYQHPTSRYSPEEKALANIAYNELGFASNNPLKRGSEMRSPDDEPDFRIAYSPAQSSFMAWMNKLPILNDMSGVTMVDAMPSRGKSKEHKKMDRKKHSKILGAAVSRDIIRMSIKTPELFLKLVERDYQYFRSVDPKITPNPLSGEKNYQMLRAEVGENSVYDETTLKALASGIEYAKYVTLFAYLHDSQTPALADIVMKAKARFPGQSKIDYSEDAELKKNIHDLVYRSKIEDIGRLFQNFSLDKRFFVAQVQSMSDENDHTLGGMLVKNKRKKGYVEKGGNPALAGLPAFDRDQVAGTIVNMEDRSNLHLPGGYKHTYRTDEEWQTPIGSFTERLQLLAYAMARRMNKSDLQNELRKALGQQGFTQPSVQDEILQNICITAEEFEYGPNFRLRELPGGDIEPVALNPGALKRLLFSFATLTYFHYQGDRSSYETLVQDLLTSIHGFQKQFTEYSASPNMEMTPILSTFIERSDRGALASLKDYPVLVHIIEKFLTKGRRLTEEELIPYLESLQREGNFALVSRAQFYPVDQKPGTLVEDEMDENKTPTPYLDIIRYRKTNGGREQHPNSLPNKLDSLAQLSGENLYSVIKLDKSDVFRLKRELKNTPKEIYREILTRALRYWMMDLKVGNTIIGNPLAGEFPLATNEESVDAIFNQQNRHLLEMAQEEELAR